MFPRDEVPRFGLKSALELHLERLETVNRNKSNMLRPKTIILEEVHQPDISRPYKITIKLLIRVDHESKGNNILHIIEQA